MSIEFYNIFIYPYIPLITKICRAYTENDEDFNDFFQEVCLQIWRSKDRFKGEAEWSTFIYRLTLNVCLTLFKKNKKVKFYSLKLEEQTEENQAFANESIEILYASIRQLNELERGIVLLHLEGSSYAEIGQITGLKVNTVGTKLKRAKEKLKKELHGKFN